MNAQDVIAKALERLDLDQWEVTPMPGSMTITRHWPDGTVDTVVLLNSETAYGHRRNGWGQTVWRFKGSLDDTITAALELASPGVAL